MHSNEADYNCPRCGEMVSIGIAHECNYMICHKCGGKGVTGWRHRDPCDWCGGSGLWVQQDDTEEDEGALVNV